MTNFITNEDHTEASQKFPRHVKHTTTAWPNLIFPFHHEVNIGIFFLFSVVFHSLMLHLVGQIEKEQNPKLVAQMVPDLIFFLSSHLVKQGEVSRHTTLSVLDRFLPFFFLHATSWHKTKLPDTQLHRSTTDFSFLFSFTPPRGTGRNFPTHRYIGPRPIFPFFFLSRHLVAKSRSPQHTAQSVPDRFLLFYTTSWHRAEVHDALLKRSTQLCGQTNK